MSYYLMFSLCYSDNKNKLLGIAQSGSTREAINKQEMEQFEIAIPNNDKLEKFGEIAYETYQQIHLNTKEVKKLSDMLSILLSQLSSR